MSPEPALLTTARLRAGAAYEWARAWRDRAGSAVADRWARLAPIGAFETGRPAIERFRHYGHVAGAAIARERTRPKRDRKRDEIDFLPAALEVMEKPPSPTGRWIQATIIAVFTLAVLWASLGHVDINASATGRVIPVGRVKVVQPHDLGRVTAIRVSEGQLVSQGDLLIELDPTESAADEGRLGHDLLTEQVKIARLSAMLDADRQETRSFAAPPNATPTLVERQHQIMAGAYQERRAKLAALVGELSERQAEERALRANMFKLAGMVPLIAEQAEARGRLAARGAGSRFKFLELQQQLLTARQDLTEAKARRAAMDVAATNVLRRRTQLFAEFRSALLAELAEAEQRASSLAQELSKAAERAARHRLTAPISGSVHQLAVHTVGAIVRPADQLLMIVPRDQPLEVEAFVLNKDIAHIEAGQPVEVKFDALPFTRYGTVPGHVRQISSDAVEREQLGLVFPARIRLSRATMMVDGREMALAPGMAVTTDIKTGERRIIEFLMAPLLRYGQEAIRER